MVSFSACYRFRTVYDVDVSALVSFRDRVRLLGMLGRHRHDRVVSEAPSVLDVGNNSMEYSIAEHFESKAVLRWSSALIHIK